MSFYNDILNIMSETKSKEDMCETLRMNFQKCILKSRVYNTECCVITGNKCNEKFKSYYLHCLKPGIKRRNSKQ